MMDEKQIESLKRRYGSRIADAPKRRRGPERMAVMKGGKPKAGGQTMLRLLSYLKRDRMAMTVAFFCVILGTVTNLVGAYMLRPIINRYIVPLDGSRGDVAGLFRSLCVMGSVYLVSVAAAYMQSRIMLQVAQNALQRLREELFNHMQTLPLRFYDTGSNGDLMSCFTNDVDTIGMMLSSTLVQLLSGALSIVGTLVLMIYTNVWLTVITLAMMPVMLRAGKFVAGRSQKYFSAQQAALGAMNGYIEEMYSGHDVVRLSRANEQVKETFGGMNAVLYDAEWRSQFLSGIMQPLMTIIGNLGYVAVCVLGSALAMSGEISFGVIVAFILYVRLFTSPLSTLAQGMTQMQTAAAAGDHVFDFLHEKELPDETGKRPELSPVQGEVEFEHVRFSYPNHPDKIIIKDFSAHIQPGQKVAIVGPTGAGKTTMVNLLMRFFEINSGNIKIDGVPTSEMTREGVHDLFSMVLQDTWLFEGTVRENLVYNKTGVTDQQLEEACRACGIYHFIETLPHGFDTVLDDSIAISSGQKQLLTIARAMIQGNPMLILDEATSSVDTRTELITQQAMDRLTEHRTSFVIAHRLSTIKNADLILVLKDGDIIEQGTHKELLAKGGFYADLYNSQFEKAS